MQLMQIKEAICAEIVKEMRSESDRLSAGRATDYAQYRQGVGAIRMGQNALDAVDRVFHKLMNDGDEE